MRAIFLASAGLLFAAWAQAQPAPTVRVRRDVHSLDPNGPEVAALRRGVAAMGALMHLPSHGGPARPGHAEDAREDQRQREEGVLETHE